MKLILPLYVYLPRKTKADKKFILNLNNYRNTHQMILAQAKVLYKEQVYIALRASKWNGEAFKCAKCTFTYFAKTKRRIDKSNPLSIIEKFACDALTDFGVWKDDDVTHNPVTVYVFGGYDKNNPRAELVVEELDNK